MAIRLGTVAAIGFEDFPPAEWLGCFRQLGCEVVQAYRNVNADISATQMNDAIAAGGMECDSLHGIFGEQYDPSTPDEQARIFAVDTFKSEGELALELGGPLVIVHCATIRRDGISAEEHDVRIAQLAKSIAELGEFGRQMNLRYAFENLPAYHAIGYQVGELAELLRQVAAPNTGMCFDTGHANMVSGAPAAIAQTGGQMIYVHLSDNFGDADSHLMPTYGSLDTDAVGRELCAAGYDGTLMLEVFAGVDELNKFIDDGCTEKLARIVQIANTGS